MAKKKSILTALAGILLLAALTVVCAYHHRPMIEADLTRRSGAALAALGLPAVRIEAQGQIITLRGEVRDPPTRLRAGAAVAAVFGVAAVRNALQVSPAAPPPPADPAPAPVVWTPEERKVAIHCQEQFSRLLREPVLFQPWRAVIDPASFPLLDRLASAAQTCPVAEIEIAGHTDPRGPLPVNMQLSQIRAESVARYLVGKGVDPRRLRPVGYGPGRPIADNATPEGMRRNRRIEFVVKGLSP